ncbi:phosphotransferase enzyme family protein [Rathayibacter sp. CAU 1779]
MFPSGLSMLWEQTDPRVALRERFGFERYEEAVTWLGEELARSWALEVVECDRILISAHNAIAWVRTADQHLVVKWSRAYPLFARFSAVADLVGRLHEAGMPVVPPIASVAGDSRVVVRPRGVQLSIAVQRNVEANHLDVADDEAVRNAGAVLARLHGAFASSRDERLNHNPQRYGETAPPADLRVRILRWLDEDDVGRAPGASARLRVAVESLRPLEVPRQLIHGDYRSGNILTAGSEVVAVLDFDEVSLDHRITDIANSLVLLRTRFTQWSPTPQEVRDTFLAGYQAVQPLGADERRWLDAVLLWRGILAIPAGDDPYGWADAL